MPFCTECGAKLWPGSNFCGQCGKQTSTVVANSTEKPQVTNRTRPIQGSCPPKPQATIVSKSGSILQKANSQPDISSRIRANSSPTANKPGAIGKPVLNRGPASSSKLSSTTEISTRPSKFQTSNGQPKYNTQRAPVTKLNTSQAEVKPTMTLRALVSPRDIVRPKIPAESHTSPRTFNDPSSSSVVSFPRNRYNDDAPPAAVSSPPSLIPRSPRSEPTFLPIKGTSSTVARQGDSKTVPSSENEVILVKSTYKAESKSAPLLLQSVNPGAPKTQPSSGHQKHMSFNTMVAGIVGHDSEEYQAQVVGCEKRTEKIDSSKPVTMYKIEVSKGGQKWFVYRRHGQFCKLMQKLRSKKMIGSDLNVPSKKGDVNECVKLLGYFIKSIMIREEIARSHYISNFLKPLQLGDTKPQ